jgi:hypothetical protein
VAEFVICARPSAPACAALGGSGPRVVDGHPVRRAGVAGVDRRGLLGRTATVMMGDIGEEIIEIDLEPLPAEAPAEAPVEPVTEPVPA